MKQISENSINSFFNAAIWGTYFKLEGKKVTFEGDLQQCFATVVLGKFYDLKNELVLDNILQNFGRKCHLINDILFEKNLFLRVYELRKKFRYVFKKGHEKNEVTKEISSRVGQHFNGFDIICHELDKKENQNFEPVDLIYKPVKSAKKNFECFFTNEINLAYHAHFQHGKETDFKSRMAEQCYYCDAFVVGKPKLKKR